MDIKQQLALDIHEAQRNHATLDLSKYGPLNDNDGGYEECVQYAKELSEKLGDDILHIESAVMGNVIKQRVTVAVVYLTGKEYLIVEASDYSKQLGKPVIIVEI